MSQSMRGKAATQPTTTSSAVRNSLFRLTLSSEIFIAASPQRLWEIITDFAAYGGWNQAIPSATGEATAGSVLRVLIHWPGLKRSHYELDVLTASPAHELRWLGHFGIKGLMDGDHRFLLEAVGADTTRLTQTECFSGALIPVFAPWLRDNVLSGFDQMNLALKARAEQPPLATPVRESALPRSSAI
ncbi:SRPBCC domain-containing protein [Candidatus Accumulibacter sp. ACC003]|uniref:SRPBCC domain-containing protein n=1 Tax=Candidatus Accumulibacter sp. ACC003 TaxID=2823334 RepID=UPI0025B8355C|nr:SRPBCC domain-containing protein [Candidatus Accumulibacter sp. ACC003]